VTTRIDYQRLTALVSLLEILLEILIYLDCSELCESSWVYSGMASYQNSNMGKKCPLYEL